MRFNPAPAMIGSELAFSPNMGSIEKVYVRLLGVPINGLRIRLRRVCPWLRGSPQRVLDAGCGRGVFSYQAAKRFPGARVTAIDLDEEQLDVNRSIASRAGYANLEFRVADVAELPFEEEFDLVLSVDNLEHVEDDQAGIECLYRALKPGGRLVLHTPGYERRWFWFAFQTNFDVPGHYRPGYWKDELAERLLQVGFVIQHAQYTFGWLETISNNISYFITKAEAKNKAIYALAFPFLNAMSWLGRNAKPSRGAGLLIIANRAEQ